MLHYYHSLKDGLRIDPDRAAPLVGPVRRLLRSDLVWRLSGLTYYSAVVATHGYFEPPSAYLAACKRQMDKFMGSIRGGSAVVEFGSGLGGNLVAVADLFSEGYGIDVNPFFVETAHRLARRSGVSNLHFIAYNGRTLPRAIPAPDVIFSFGVFERLPKDLVRGYIRQLRDILRPGGRMVLSFLTEAAFRTTFVHRLGSDAYVPWTTEEIQRAARVLGLEIESLIPHGEWPVGDGQHTLPVAMVGVFHRSVVNSLPPIDS